MLLLNNRYYIRILTIDIVTPAGLAELKGPFLLSVSFSQWKGKSVREEKDQEGWKE